MVQRALHITPEAQAKLSEEGREPLEARRGPLDAGREPRLHVAIIMDGNGRWATARGRPRTAGHRAGVEAVRRTIEAARDLNIGTLTLFAFSSDNWRRPAREVWSLMRLLNRYLREEVDECVRRGVRLQFIGRRDRLSLPLSRALEAAEQKTAGGRSLCLRVAIDYSARDAILRAAERLRACQSSAGGAVSRETFARLLADECEERAQPAPDVDLLIRTGGEQRLSDFLLWESAYAELYFTPLMWPDFQASDLETAVCEFHSRERRFGGVKAIGGER